MSHRETAFAGCAIILALALMHPQAWGDQAVSADGFVDSAGVNVHLGFWDTPYRTNFPGSYRRYRGLESVMSAMDCITMAPMRVPTTTSSMTVWPEWVFPPSTPFRSTRRHRL